MLSHIPPTHPVEARINEQPSEFLDIKLHYINCIKTPMQNLNVYKKESGRLWFRKLSPNDNGWVFVFSKSFSGKMSAN